ncbi:MAG: Gfo/Idh/MocA family oxidoreductase, partial [Hyphomicrobiales bacterium]|nr:Gfo/Idh/MocA family oxidoreductase [Hyphomicrobiales bacterium]
ARASGRVAILGYNYVQNPLIAQARALIEAGAIGDVNHFRVEMDEDYLADPDAPHSWRSERKSGYGALDDFCVHPLSLVAHLLGPTKEVFGEMAKPYADRPAGAGRRAVETHDIVTALLRLESGVCGTIMADRCAWGRKGRIFVQVYGSKGMIAFDQERFNELQLYVADGPEETRGFRTILSGPAHPPYGRFIAAPGHQIGFNDLKTIECRAFLDRIEGRASTAVDFEAGLAIERTIHAIARAFDDGRWTAVASLSS